MAEIVRRQPSNRENPARVLRHLLRRYADELGTGMEMSEDFDARCGALEEFCDEPVEVEK